MQTKFSTGVPGRKDKEEVSNECIVRCWKKAFKDGVVELIPLQVEMTSRIPSNSICIFRIFDQVSNMNPIHPMHILIDPNHLIYWIHLRPVRFIYDPSDTNVRLPDRISRFIKQLSPSSCPRITDIYIFYHVHVHLSFVNIHFYHVHLYLIVLTHHDSGSGSISWILLSSTYCSESSCVVSPFISLLFHCLLFQIFLSFTLHKPCTLQTK